MGVAQGARNEIFALQPAPVQTSYMGFPATMGASFLPYLITGEFTLCRRRCCAYTWWNPACMQRSL